MSDVVVTTGAIRRAELQPNRHQQTNTQQKEILLATSTLLRQAPIQYSRFNKILKYYNLTEILIRLVTNTSNKIRINISTRCRAAKSQ